MKSIATFLLIACGGLIGAGQTLAAEEADSLHPRVPNQDLEAARALKNPLTGKRNVIDQGRALYYGKGFCVACHGVKGSGITDVDPILLKGMLPTAFTSTQWQAARADGELLWVLKHGSPGTAMASFVPSVLSEQEAWQIILYLRSLGGL